MNFGVIVVGYPGIGKSTLASKDLHYIDLESSNFFIGDERLPDWYIHYCRIAISLAEQGYVVFTSSHREVGYYFNHVRLPDNVKLVCCVPSLSLKDMWTAKLWDRWRTTYRTKDFRAYFNSQERFEDNIRELKESFNIVCEIPGIHYDLNALLTKTFKDHGIDTGVFRLGIKVY